MESRPNPSDYLILVCDDEESVRALLVEALTEWNFRVASAPNGEAALAYIKAGNLPHVVLTDIRMGGMTGIELAAEVKKLSDEVEIVIMTSHGSFETAVQAMRLGVYDYLSKPFENIEDVRAILLHVCQRIFMRFYNEFLVEELKRRREEAEGLSRMTTELSKTLEFGKVMQIACAALAKAFHGPVVFFGIDLPQSSLVARARLPENLLGGAEFRVPLPAKSLTAKGLEEFVSQGEFESYLQTMGALSPEHLPPSGARWRSFCLKTRTKLVGVFSIYSKELEETVMQALLERYVQNIATAFENSELHSRVVEISVRDGLTGLFNVRHFRERFEQEIALARRLNHPTSLLFFDVDHFKKYNDAHGHPAGDEVLRRMAKLMRDNFRSTDILARYGGEEFVVLCTHTGFADAYDKAERFRALVEATPFPRGEAHPLGKITVTVGVSEYPTHANTVEAVIKAADVALYEGKTKSRNVVVPGTAAPGYVPAFVSVSLRSKARFQPPND